MINFIKKPLVAAILGVVGGVLIDETARFVGRKVNERKALKAVEAERQAA